MPTRKLTLLELLGLALLASSLGEAAKPPPLQLETKIALGKVSGRIDHMAMDLGRQRLFVAELGNNTVGVVDVKEGRLLKTIAGPKEPQGVGYEPSTDTLFVADAGDGAVLLFEGPKLAPAGRIELGDDADNIRIDADHGRVIVGYGNGSLAMIDPKSRAKTGSVTLDGHPESFQLDGTGERIFVNVPSGRHVAVIEGAARATSAKWRLGDAGANFPMAVDQEASRLVVVTRSPAKLLAFGLSDGSLAAKTDSCGDADDIFVDPKRHRVYVSCGEGFIDVFEPRDGGYEKVAQIRTASGARTSFFSPELDGLFLAVRASGGEPAAIWVFRPTP
jgi:DNA-binding beta-propeller fold protein YncE